MREFQPLITSSELAAHLDDPAFRIVDCRFDLMDPGAGRRDWLEGHIPGAVFADLDRDLSGPVGPESGRHPLPDVQTLALRFGELGIDGDSHVVVYDAGNGAYAVRAWWLLRWLGHERVQLLDRGYAGWKDKNRQVEAGETRVDRRTFHASPVSGMVLTTEDIVAAGRRLPQLNLVDARDADRFRGDAEPIDAVAGHIPGSANLPFAGNLRADGSWKSPVELRARLAAAIGEDPTVRWSVMCGSGVTACHLALAAIVAGYREPALYVGSWSEWIRDPDRPIGTGT